MPPCFSVLFGLMIFLDRNGFPFWQWTKIGKLSFAQRKNEKKDINAALIARTLSLLYQMYVGFVVRQQVVVVQMCLSPSYTAA